MFDKCHYQWICSNLSTKARIFSAQREACDFLKQLGDDAYSVAMDIKGGTLQRNAVRLYLFDLALHYYKVRKGIFEQWAEVS